MPRAEWFRRTSWSPADQADFLAHLGRCRSGSSKAQYLRIQAYHLQATRDTSMILASLGLLDQVLREYPESSELATVYFQQGDCLTMLGRDGEAIESLRRSIEMQRRRPSVRNSAHLAFGELVVRLRLRELYAEVLRDLDDLGDLDDLPIEQYRQQVIRASILDESGRLDEARQAAAQALKASEQTQSPYRNHPKIGLVGSPDRRVQEWLAAIVSRGGRA